MSERKAKDVDYLTISAMLRARESKMLDREKTERMLSAPSYTEAAKLLVDCGYEDMSVMDIKGVNTVLNAKRQEIFDEVAQMAPRAEIVDAFRLKYDYHNAKVIVKSEGAGTPGEHLLSGSGRVSGEALKQAYAAEDFRFVPAALGKAMIDAKETLARTGNPQLADIALDKACFAEMSELAKSAGSGFLESYTKILIEAANIRSAVRVLRMGKGYDFLVGALIPGGIDSPGSIAQAATSGDGLASVSTANCLKEAASLGADAISGGSMTKFELNCDNSVTSFLSSAKLVPFGCEPVVEYLALVELEIASIRMILTGRYVGMDPAVIQERLRDINA